MNLSDSRRWTEQGTALIAEILPGLDFPGPSLLPEWTRAHVVAHLCGNARGLGNLVRWAATGVETPMYASMEKRDADIEEWSALPADELIARYAGSAAELDAAMDALDDRQWSAEVVTRLGIPIPATLIPWLRAREVMIHAVDLNAGIDFDELPSDFLMALCADIAASRGANPGPAVRLTVIASDQPDRGGLADLPGLSWAIAGDGDAAEVTGTLGAIAAYLAGRGSDGLTRVGGGVVPALPAWL